jgi:hypothetical protein
VRTGEHGRCSNDHLSDSPQDGSQGRARYTRGESAENLSNSCRGVGVGGKDRVERPLTDTLALEARKSEPGAIQRPIEALMGYLYH